MNRDPAPSRRTRSQHRELWLVLVPTLIILAAALGYFWATWPQPKAIQPASRAAPSLAAPEIQPGEPAPPPRFAAQIARMGNGFAGRVGIAVHVLGEGWTAGHDHASRFPQQSVSKLWVAATVLDRVDRGELGLSETIALTARDLTIFHQPIRKKIGNGIYQASLAELLHLAMTQSDNSANEALFRRVGGKQAVEAFLAGKGLNQISLSQGERELQMAITGMQWEDRFSYGRTFWRVREAMPIGPRAKAMGEYVTRPIDGATPEDVAKGLALLQRGALLSPQSTARLLELMKLSVTGPDRLKSGLSPGWTLAHKTGTGQVMGYYATAYNDVGILTSPRGEQYALVVMIASTRQSVPQRQALMRAVTQHVIKCAEAGWDLC